MLVPPHCFAGKVAVWTAEAVLRVKRCIIIGILDKPLAFHCSGTARESMTLCAKTWGQMMKCWPSSNISRGLHPVSASRALVHTYDGSLSLGKYGKSLGRYLLLLIHADTFSNIKLDP